MGEQNQNIHIDDYLIGVGHPLLDISLDVDDKFLAKYVCSYQIIIYELSILILFKI